LVEVERELMPNKRCVVYLPLLVLAAVAFSLPTYADTYDFIFTATSGVPPTDGSFTYNGSEFTAFNIDLPNSVIGLNAVEQDLSLLGITDTQYFEDITSTATGYYYYVEGTFNFGRAGLILNGPGDPNPTNEANIAEAVNVGGQDVNNSVGDEGVGTYTQTNISAVPEPDALSLLFAGLVGLGLMMAVSKACGENRCVERSLHT
jgi:hypothetical protein